MIRRPGRTRRPAGTGTEASVCLRVCPRVPAVPVSCKSAGSTAGPARGRALERPRWGGGAGSGRDLPGPSEHLTGGPAVKGLGNTLGLGSATLSAGHCLGCSSSQTSFPGTGDTCSGQTQAMLQPVRSHAGPLPGETHIPVGCWLTLSRRCQNFLIIDHPK